MDKPYFRNLQEELEIEEEFASIFGLRQTTSDPYVRLNYA
jgi:hypothetical protein